MLQSSSQYLRPDYLAAPTALDTKSSPLALLAQTCSAIGADTTNPKLLAANIEKSTKSLKGAAADGRDKSSPVSSLSSSSVSTGSAEQLQQQQQPPQPSLQHYQQQQQQQQMKSSFKPYESSNSNHVRDHLEGEADHVVTTVATNSHRVKTPKSSNSSLQSNGQQQQQQQRCDSNQSATSQRESPAAVCTPNGMRRTPCPELQRTSSPQRSNSKESAAAGCMPSAQTSPNATNHTSAAARLQAASEAAYAKEANYVKALHAAAAAAGMTPSSGAGSNANSSNPPYYSTGYGGGAAAGMAYPMDLMAASALMSSPHHPMFKAAAMNPYLNYARFKGLDPAMAAAMMSPPQVCRDPYCTGCPASPHFLNKAAGQPCAAGCPHCDGTSGKSTAGNSGNNSTVAAAAISSYHAQLATLAAASQLPYVCSWIASDAAYCGKRFGTSDELFQHLRTHTASMPDSVLSAAAAGGIPPNHPLFQRTYPTPPLSPMSAARYHPYGKPSMLPPSLAGLSMPPHPALAQYFSPYSLYGPRLGSSHP